MSVNETQQKANELIDLGKNFIEEESYDEALTYFYEALKLNPKIEEKLHEIAKSYYALNDGEGVISCVNAMERFNENTKYARYGKGIMNLRAAGNLALRNVKNPFSKLAVECFDNAIKIDVNFADAWLQKGVALTFLKKYKEALECIDKALEIDSKSEDVYYFKGRIYLQMKKYKELFELIENAINQTLSTSRFLGLKVVAYLILKKDKEAHAIFNEILSGDDDPINAYFGVGSLLLFLGRMKKACKYIDEAMKLNPNFVLQQLGFRTEEETIKKGTHSIVCPKCGSEQARTAKFCLNCGKDLRIL